MGGVVTVYCHVDALIGVGSLPWGCLGIYRLHPNILSHALSVAVLDDADLLGIEFWLRACGDCPHPFLSGGVLTHFDFNIGDFLGVFPFWGCEPRPLLAYIPFIERQVRFHGDLECDCRTIHLYISVGSFNRKLFRTTLRWYIFIGWAGHKQQRVDCKEVYRHFLS